MRAISRSQIANCSGVGALSETYKKGTIVLDGETEISNGEDEVEITICRIGKMFEENIEWDSGEIPRIFTTKACSKQIPKQPLSGRMELQQAGNPSLMRWSASREATILRTSHLNSMVRTMRSLSGESKEQRTSMRGTDLQPPRCIIVTASMSFFPAFNSKGQGWEQCSTRSEIEKGARHDKKFVEWLKDFS